MQQKVTILKKHPITNQNLHHLFLSTLPFAIIFALTLVIYSSSLNGEFVFDDFKTIEGNLNIYKLSSLDQIWKSQPSRFIGYLSFALNFQVGQLNVYVYHLTNVFIHLINGVLVFFLANSIFKEDENTKKIHSKLAFLTALIFVSHPIQTQAVSYLTQRFAELGAFFYFLSLNFYLLTLKLYKDRGLQVYNPKKLLLTFLLSLSFGTLAFFTKENTYTLPIVWILFTIFYFRENLRKNLFPIGISLALFLCALFAASNLSTEIRSFGDHIDTKYLITQIPVVKTYLRLSIFPINQNLDYYYPIANSIKEPVVLFSATVISLLIISAIILLRKNAIYSLGIFFFFSTLTVESLFPLQDVIFEHRLYLPLFGLILSITSLVATLQKNYRFAFVFCFLIVFIFSITTYQRNKVWQNNLNLWTDVVKKSPQNSRAYNSLGVAYMKEGDYGKAIGYLLKATYLNPNYVEAYINMGEALENVKNNEDAKKIYTNVLLMHHNNAMALKNLARVESNIGNFESALELYNDALNTAPNDPGIYSGIGIIYLNQKIFEKSQKAFTKAIEINPYVSETYEYLAITYEMQGKPEEAKKVREINSQIALPQN